MADRKVYRLAFDFNSAEGMKEFFEGIQANSPYPIMEDGIAMEDDGFHRSRIVHHDGLMDGHKSIQLFHVRHNCGDAGNGRPAVFETLKTVDKVVVR
jgi:hypothetical protein